jgi:UDPglucose 6-dehydrogenase
MRIAVIGTGYLGVTHAAGLAELGHEVTGVDVDEAKVAALREGSVPFYEPDLEPLVRKHVEGGRLTFTTSYEQAADADVHFLCVGTPQRHGDYAADLTAVHAATDSLAAVLRRPTLVVGKSTVPVGTAVGLRDRLVAGAPAGRDVHLAWNPEFLREGHAVADTLHPDRLVVGVEDPADVAPVREVYDELLSAGVPWLVTTLPTAELVKTAANAFLATKISFINAMAELCEATGADVVDLADALGYDARIGRRFLDAGLGFGGGCLPKDIRAFMARAGELGVDEALGFLREIDAINVRRRQRVVEMARQMVGGRFLGTRVAVLGAAFKPDSDDTRDSPALNVAGQIQLQGATVTVYDPKAMDNARREFPTLGYAPSLLGAVEGADAVLLLTEWSEFRGMDPDTLAAVVRRRRILDGRNVLDPDRWRAAGWVYHGLGRP